MLSGELDPGVDRRSGVSEEEIAAGWRMACRHSVDGDLVLEVRQWDSPILTDETPFAFTPRDGYGVAVDLGTTTLAAQLLDLRSGEVKVVRTALNPQAPFGSDIMHRVAAAVAEGKQGALQSLIRKQIGRMIDEMTSGLEPGVRIPLREIVLVGNTPMHNLFCGIDVSPLAGHPFHQPDAGLKALSARDVGWDLVGDPTVQFLPAMGGFVGSDILAGVIATRMHEDERLNVLVDLGTNGELVVGNRDGLLCASTAAGPAFEAATIGMGMRATTGAIHEVTVADGSLVCGVLGNGPAQGICGSGLVDAIAACLDLDRIAPTGRIRDGAMSIPLADSVVLSQRDVRELQLAKGAIAAGIQILLDTWGASLDDVTHCYLAGAFGNYIRLSSARRIGLLKFPLERIIPSGNTALLGAKLALFADEGDRAYAGVLERVRHISLNAAPRFHDIYVDEMELRAPVGVEELRRRERAGGGRESSEIMADLEKRTSE